LDSLNARSATGLIPKRLALRRKAASSGASAGVVPYSTSARFHLRATSSCAMASICIAWLGRVCSRCGAHCAARRTSSGAAALNRITSLPAAASLTAATDGAGSSSTTWCTPRASNCRKAAGSAAAFAASAGTSSVEVQPASCSRKALSFSAICTAGSERPAGASGKPFSRVWGS
jgi:hypothetical protein